MGGRVLARDLIKHPDRAVVDLDAHTDHPVRGIRKVIARRMVESLQTTSQLSLHGWADARALKALRAAFKEDEETSGITIGDLVNFAGVRTLLEFPAFNAHYLGETIRRFEHVHLGVATDTEKGLMVPVLFGSDLMSLKELSARTKVLATRARDGVAQPDELAGSTFTVSNVGSFGIEAFTPVLNIPEVAILGVGTIVLKPVSTKNGVEFIDHIGLSLTMDHQAVDGADAARFMRALIDRIAMLDRLLIRMGSTGTVGFDSYRQRPRRIYRRPARRNIGKEGSLDREGALWGSVHQQRVHPDQKPAQQREDLRSCKERIAYRRRGEGYRFQPQERDGP